MRHRTAALVLSLAFLTGAHAKPKGETALAVGPGPTTLSAEEAALAPDPATGGPHAIVLLEESDVDESMGVDREHRYHLRAKILTNEGRSLADIEVPYVKRADKIKEWWARTILPDGKVLELPLAQTVQDTAVKMGGTEVRTIKAALPGVVPGAVIDYGYVLHESTLAFYRRVDLQRKFPIRKLRLRWRPSELFQGAYRIYGAGLPVKSAKDKQAILIEGNDLPPFVEEPWMPPDYHVRGSVTFYYVDPTVDSKRFWEDQGREIERLLGRFIATDRPIKEVIAGWNLSPEMPLQARLEHAYRWVTEHVKDTGLLSFEELAAAGKDEENEAYTAKQVLKNGEGSGWQVSALFAGFARALGAEAHLALATDRRRMVWDASLLSMAPFDYVLVAVRLPGAGDEAFALVDPGTGLDYGEVPWWTTGAHAMLASKTGYKALPVPASDPRRNVSDTTATFSFDEEGTMHVEWSRTHRNLRGFDERRHLKDLDGHARQERLSELCGRGGDVEVGRAESPGLDDKFGALRLECALDRELAGPTEEIGRYSFTLDGPWTEPLPDFEGRQTRVHAAVFDFGRVDKAKLAVQAPPGFAAKGPLPPRQIETPFGRYMRKVEVEDGGYHVERGVAFTPLMVPATEYEALRTFLEEIRRADQEPLEFERKP